MLTGRLLAGLSAVRHHAGAALCLLLPGATVYQHCLLCVLVNTEVFFVALLSYWMWKEKISRKMFLGIVVTFLGSVVVSAGDSKRGAGLLVGDVFRRAGRAVWQRIYVDGQPDAPRAVHGIYTFLIYTASFSGAVSGQPGRRLWHERIRPGQSAGGAGAGGAVHAAGAQRLQLGLALLPRLAGVHESS